MKNISRRNTASFQGIFNLKGDFFMEKNMKKNFEFLKERVVDS